MSKVTIIIPICNGWEFTDACLLSILECTKTEDINIVVIDNNSTDKTREILEKFSLILPMSVIRNDRNIGFPESVNLGISCRTNGEDVCLLNNDTIVCQGWIEGLKRHFDKKDVGIVGACSNKVKGNQKKTIPSYSTKEEYYKESKEYMRQNKGKYQYASTVMGLCMLIRGEVIDDVGLFDPIYTPGNYEDDDFCLRSIEKGWYPVIAEDVFIHHFGSATHNLLQIDYQDLLKRNFKIFESKWIDKIDKIHRKVDRKNKAI